jgi:hypothetical protein
MHQVKEIIHHDPEGSILEVDAQEMSSLPIAVARVLEYVNSSRKAILLPDFAVTYAKPVVCEVMPKLAEIVGTSKTLFAPGVFTVFTSLSIDPALRLWTNYLMGTVIDTGLMQSTIDKIALDFTPILTGHPYVGRVCDGKKDHSEPHKAFGMSAFEPIFRTYGILICLAFVALMIERRLLTRVKALALLLMQYGVKLLHWILDRVKRLNHFIRHLFAEPDSDGVKSRTHLARLRKHCILLH